MKKNEDIFKVSTSKAFRAMLFSGGVIVVVLVLTILFVMPMPEWNFDKVFLLCLSGCAILFFLWIFRSVSKLYNNPEKGIIINDEGIKIDINERRFVRWAEITDLQINVGTRSVPEIVIFTEETENLLESSRLRQFMLNVSDATPKNSISVCNRWLECDFLTLVEAVEKRFNKYKSSQSEEVREKAKPGQREATPEEIKKEKKKIYVRILRLLGVFVLFYLLAILAMLIYFAWF